MADKSWIATYFLFLWIINFTLLLVLLGLFHGGSAFNADEVRCGSGFPCKSFVIFPFAFGICWAVYQSVVLVINCVEIFSQKSVLSSLLLSAVVFFLDFSGLCIWTAVIVIAAVPKTIENYATPSGITIQTNTRYNDFMTSAAGITGIMIFFHYIYTFLMALVVYDNYKARRAERLAERKRIREKASKTPMYEFVPAPWAPPIPQQPMSCPGTPTEPHHPGMPTGEPATMPMPIQAPPAKMV